MKQVASAGKTFQAPGRNHSSDGIILSFSDAKIEDYSKFSAWYVRSVATPPARESDVLELAQGIGACLQTEQVSLRYDLWTDCLADFIGSNADTLASYQKNDRFLKDLGIDLTMFISDFATVGIELDRGQIYVPLVDALADLTNLLSYRFLSAWMALNLNDLEKCVFECEKVDHPYAAIYTMHGQALLEMGKAAEAIEVLNIAIELDPKEVLGQFQLAKASLVSGDHAAAWRAAKACWRHSTNDPEVAILLSLIANEMAPTPKIMDEAWSALSSFLQNGCTNEALILNLLELSFKKPEKEWARLVVERTNWGDVFSRLEIYQKIGKILRSFGDNGWLDLASVMLKDFDKKKMPLSG
jgi:tetratricopeptide (TPR) repeat protein